MIPVALVHQSWSAPLEEAATGICGSSSCCGPWLPEDVLDATVQYPVPDWRLIMDYNEWVSTARWSGGQRVHVTGVESGGIP